MEPKSTLICRFIRVWAPPMGDPRRKEFLDDLRDLSIAAQRDFRTNQKKGLFTDGVGDSYLEKMVKAAETAREEGSTQRG